ncbi:MAG: NAD(P)-dependent oxidoreductase [Solidesulfovibrio sp. DCME]|uniref:NAD(P)-dependent oxidoreductase n=1 Tax=Solidesulfovibrio sp. DCME TaxID=3447380 RepID=UPI003D117535
MGNVGIVGTGVMGRAVAAVFLEKGLAVHGYDAFGPCVKVARENGIIMHGSLAALARATDRIILFLPGPAEIAACVAGPGGLLAAAAPGTVIIDMCTSAPETTRAMADAAKAAGVRYLDAPVLGRPATIGKWALPVGGEAEDCALVEPLLRLFAAHVVHMGPSGSGHKVKLLNQMMFGAINAMTAEMMAVADKVGIAPGRLYDIITASQAGTVSNLFKELGRRVSEQRYDDPTFTVALLAKDVRLGLEMADQAGAPPLVGRTVDFLNRASCAQGFGGEDTSVMWKSLGHIWQGGDAHGQG